MHTQQRSRDKTIRRRGKTDNITISFVTSIGAESVVEVLSGTCFRRASSSSCTLDRNSRASGSLLTSQWLGSSFANNAKPLSKLSLNRTHSSNFCAASSLRSAAAKSASRSWSCRDAADRYDAISPRRPNMFHTAVTTLPYWPRGRWNQRFLLPRGRAVTHIRLIGFSTSACSKRNAPGVFREVVGFLGKKTLHKKGVSS